MLIAIDYFIIAILSYLIFYYFDRVSLSSRPVISSFDFSMAINFLYPVIDLLILGYYININKTYIVSDRKVYLPLIAGISIWTISDFLFAYEEIFGLPANGIGEYLQGFGLIALIIIMVLIKCSKIDSCYTTIDLYRDNSKLRNTNLLMNSLILLYIIIYLSCVIIFADSVYPMNTVNTSGIILLMLAILRQNIIHYDIQRKFDKMSRDASTDPLTGLFSRKYVFTLMHSLYKSSLYFNISISALMLDIDHFKDFNDTYGHIKGDHVLKDIAQLINRSIDTSNILCRYGGEEFLLVLPGVDQTNGLLIAEKIRKNIEEYDFSKDMPYPGKVTVSIGGATAGRKTQNETDLVEQADLALYKAKEVRNKSVWFTAV